MKEKVGEKSHLGKKEVIEDSMDVEKCDTKKSQVVHHLQNDKVMEDSIDVEKCDTEEKSQVVCGVNVGKEYHLPKGSSEKSHVQKINYGGFNEVSHWKQ